ncbi:hypothetical protein [Methylocystis sp. JR02]|uniref:hypothetical protein n=1 Tax=Methylocystis sp. JR02 TaxID=3046284 RepID=UPI0024B9EB29|nr:hypothetical protein [Methylocystis sp. JR02]MDJ0447114.1 hypothetical protein [Methylocystis sp. JR02]
MSVATEGLVRCIYGHVLNRPPSGTELGYWASIVETQGAQIVFELISESMEANSIRREAEKKFEKRRLNHFAQSRQNTLLADRHLDDLIAEVVSRPVNFAFFGFDSAAFPAAIHRRLGSSRWISLGTHNDVDDDKIVDVAVCGPTEISAISRSENSRALRAKLLLFALNGFSYEHSSLSFAFRVCRDEQLQQLTRQLEQLLEGSFVRWPEISGMSVANGSSRHPVLLFERKKVASFPPILDENFVQFSLAKLALCHYIVSARALACRALDELDRRAGSNFCQRYAAIAGLLET